MPPDKNTNTLLEMHLPTLPYDTANALATIRIAQNSAPAAEILTPPQIDDLVTRELLEPGSLRLTTYGKSMHSIEGFTLGDLTPGLLNISRTLYLHAQYPLTTKSPALISSTLTYDYHPIAPVTYVANAIDQIADDQPWLNALQLFIDEMNEARYPVGSTTLIRKSGLYIHLYNGYRRADDPMDRAGLSGPFIGPLNHVQTFGGDYILYSLHDREQSASLEWTNGRILYAGWYYTNMLVTHHEILQNSSQPQIP